MAKPRRGKEQSRDDWLLERHVPALQKLIDDAEASKTPLDHNDLRAFLAQRLDETREDWIEKSAADLAEKLIGKFDKKFSKAISARQFELFTHELLDDTLDSTFEKLGNGKIRRASAMSIEDLQVVDFIELKNLDDVRTKYGEDHQLRMDVIQLMRAGMSCRQAYHEVLDRRTPERKRSDGDDRPRPQA